MPNDAVAAEKNLRRKIDAWRRAMYELILLFLPPEYGGIGLTDLGIMCGNTRESLEKTKAIARKSGFSARHPAFDVDGDGATTSWDIELWLNDPSRSTVPEMGCWGEGDCEFDYGVTNGDRMMQEEFLLGELQRLRAMEMDLLHEALAGEFDRVGTLDKVLPRGPEDAARRRTAEFLGRAQRQDGWPLAAALAAIGVGSGTAITLVGYAWQLLRGGWTQHGVSEVDAAAQGAEALREASLARWPLYNDLRRFGDAWDSAKNAPMDPPRSGSGPMRLIEDVHRWGRALLDPFTRFFFCGSLLAPRVHDAAITTWWRRAVGDTDIGRVKAGRPVTVRLTRIAPIARFSDDEQIGGTTGQNGTTNGITKSPTPPRTSAATEAAQIGGGAVAGAAAPIAEASPDQVAMRLMAEDRPVPWEVLKDISGAALARVLAHNQSLAIRKELAAERAKGRTPHWTEYLTPSERGDLVEGRLTEAKGRALAADRGYSEPTKTAASSAY